MADNFNYVQLQDLYLAGSGVGISDTSITLKSMQFVDGTNVAMTDFGDIGYMTLEPNTEREENISFTGITQNANGTATLTGVVRGLEFSSPYEADTSLRNSHSGGSLVVASNSTSFYNQLFTRNIITLGDGTNVADKELIWDCGEPSDKNPEIKYDYTNNQLKFRRYGETSFTEIPLSLRGTYADYASLPTDGSNGDIAITTDDYKLYVYDSTTPTWVLAGGSSGAGTMYVTEKLGSEATGADNRTFDLTAGSWPDSRFLMVYQNGQLMREGATEDYTVTDSDTIVFNYDVEDTSLVTMIVVSVDLYNPDWNNVTEDILPDVTSTHDIGSSSLKFTDLHLSGDVNVTAATNISAATATPTASKIPIADGSGKLDDGWLNTTAFNIISSDGFTAGEDLDANDAVRQGIEDQTTDPRIFISQTTADQTTNSASRLDDTSKLEAQSFTTGSSQTERILSVTLGLRETGASGNETFTVRLYEDSSGEPGSEITSKQLLVNLLGGQVVYPTFEFATPQELATNTLYWISVESDRTGGRDADVSYNSTSVYASGNRARSTNGGSSWTDAPTNDLYFIINYTDTDGRIYKTDALSQNVSDAMIGYISTSASASDTDLTVNHMGIIDGFTGLTSGSVYYLSDTPGEIADSNGTVTKKIGVALTTTKFLAILDF